MSDLTQSWDAFQDALLAKCTDLAAALEVDGVAVVAAGERMLVGVGWNLPLGEEQSVHGIAAGERLVLLFIVEGDVWFMDPSEGLVDAQLADICERIAQEAEAFAQTSPEHATLLPPMSDEEREKLDAL